MVKWTTVNEDKFFADNKNRYYGATNARVSLGALSHIILARPLGDQGKFMLIGSDGIKKLPKGGSEHRPRETTTIRTCRLWNCSPPELIDATSVNLLHLFYQSKNPVPGDNRHIKKKRCPTWEFYRRRGRQRVKFPAPRSDSDITVRAVQKKKRITHFRWCQGDTIITC